MVQKEAVMLSALTVLNAQGAWASTSTLTLVSCTSSGLQTSAAYPGFVRNTESFDNLPLKCVLSAHSSVTSGIRG